MCLLEGIGNIMIVNLMCMGYLDGILTETRNIIHHHVFSSLLGCVLWMCEKSTKTLNQFLQGFL